MSDHAWRFFRAGGSEQVKLETAADLRALATLDQKLWVALASPVAGLAIEHETLALIDKNNDGRLRAPEILDAVAWMDKVLKDLGDLTKRADALPLSAIDDKSEEGQAVLATAKRLLAEMGRPDADVITVADTADATKLLNKMRFNGDGVVTEAAAEADAAKQLIRDIIATAGGDADRSGDLGVSKERLDAFFKELDAYLGWWERAQRDAEQTIPLGDKTPAAVEAFVAVRAKIEDYFTRCELAAFDPRAAAHMSRAAEDWAPVAQRTLSHEDDEIAQFPLARVTPEAELGLIEGINPAWKEEIERFVRLVVWPLLGAEVEALDRRQWRQLGERFASYEQWLAGKEGALVESLGVERLREIRDAELKLKIEALIAEDESHRAEAESCDAVNRATRYYRDLHQLLENFVSFRDFYMQREKAIFQAGTLYLDGRSCELCVRVEDAAKHSALAQASHAYLAYCNCVRKDSDEKMIIAAAFTDGGSDFLVVGRNGLFYDRDGKDWDATIVKLVEQPISVREAFWTPYKRLGKFITAQFEKFATDRDKAVEASSLTAVSSAGTKIETTVTTPASSTSTSSTSTTAAGANAAPAQPAAKAPAGPAGASSPAAATVANPASSATSATAFDIGKFAGIFAAIGLAAGVVLSAISGIISSFLSLRVWQMPFAIGGVMLVISGPSMLLAAIKLRQRNLAPILDASGWAINARARLNVRFGASLTSVAKLPKHAQVDVEDPYRDGRSPAYFYVTIILIILVIAILWDMGLIRRWTGLDEVDLSSITKPATSTSSSPSTTPANPLAPKK